jgi:hypothetical protein
MTYGVTGYVRQRRGDGWFSPLNQSELSRAED